jgi:hypothetical protein
MEIINPITGIEFDTVKQASRVCNQFIKYLDYKSVCCILITAA